MPAMFKQLRLNMAGIFAPHEAVRLSFYSIPMGMLL